MTQAMTKAELEVLQRLVRQREKVRKTEAKQRKKELAALFENQMAAKYSFEDDPVFAKLFHDADQFMAKTDKALAARCRELGIPRNTGPRYHGYWAERGENAFSDRRAELRKVAMTAFYAEEAKAIAAIERDSLDAQTKLAGLSSEAARAFIEKELPNIETLMPPRSFEEIIGETEPPIVEYVTANTVRQRRYRERQKALRDASHNASDAPRNALPKTNEDGDDNQSS